jgi:hypothetical protein
MKCEFEKQIIEIDKKIKNAQKSGNSKDVLLAFTTIDPEIFGKLFFGLPEEKFIDYCEQYRGFETAINMVSHILEKSIDPNNGDMHITDPFASNIQPILEEAQSDSDTALENICDFFDDNEIDEAKKLTVFVEFLTDAIENAADRLDDTLQGGAAFLYAEIEKFAHAKGDATIRSTGGELSEKLSLSDINENDPSGAMNYLGSELSATLYKKMYELPTSLLSKELPLRAIEALLVNLLHQKYDHPHDILDQFTRNAHLSLADQQGRFRN